MTPEDAAQSAAALHRAALLQPREEAPGRTVRLLQVRFKFTRRFLLLKIMDAWFWELKVFADFEVPIINIIRHHIITFLNVKGVVQRSACSEDPTENYHPTH